MAIKKIPRMNSTPSLVSKKGYRSKNQGIIVYSLKGKEGESVFRGFDEYSVKRLPPELAALCRNSKK